MSFQYDITMKVNLTVEYSEEQTLTDVKADAHTVLDDFEKYMGDCHAWACDVSGGKASRL